MKTRGGVMIKKATEGFEKIEDLRLFEEKLLEKNEMIFYVWKVSLNLALRVSDTLRITTEEAKGYLKTGTYHAKDKKTKKINMVKLNENTIKSLKEAIKLRESLNVNEDNKYLFVSGSTRSKNSLNHLSRIQIFRVYKEICDWHSLDINIGTHSARKTWGLQVYNATKDIAIVQQRLNHSSPKETLRYIGNTQKKMNNLVEEFNL